MNEPTIASLRRASVLIVEDSPDQRVLIDAILRRTLPELIPIWANDAATAIKYLSTCELQNKPFPKLVLMDLYLPTREEGWGLFRQLKAQKIPNRMPVVILSRSDDPEDIRTSYDLGVASYITKPGSVAEWTRCFQTLRQYWFGHVTLPSA